MGESWLPASTTTGATLASSSSTCSARSMSAYAGRAASKRLPVCSTRSGGSSRAIADDLRQHGVVIGGPRLAVGEPTQVPIGDVQEAHDGYRSSKARASASTTRVGGCALGDARREGGEGKRRGSGAGMMGAIRGPWCLAENAPRARAARSRGSGTPTLPPHPGDDDLQRGVADDVGNPTSSADCCAPTSNTPRLRPRAAMSTSTSLMGSCPGAARTC